MRGVLVSLFFIAWAADPARSAEKLAATVASIRPEATSVKDKEVLKVALKAGADAYTAASTAEETAARNSRLQAAASATEAATKQSEDVAKTVLAEQQKAAKDALAGLREAASRSTWSAAMSKRAHDLDMAVQTAEQDAAKKLEALDEVKAIAEEKKKNEESATNVLTAAKKRMTETSKEAELAAEVAEEKKQELKDLTEKEHAAEKALDSARTEAEAVSEMVDKKKSVSEAAESELQNVTKKAADMAKLAKEKKQGEDVQEKMAEHTDKKKAGTTPEKVTESKASPVVPSSEHALVTDKSATPSADVDSKLAALKTENERLKLEKDRLAKQLQAQELERQNEKLSKEKEELEKKVHSKSADGDKKNRSDGSVARGFGASPAVSATPAPTKLQLHKKLKKHLD
jgi:hypothetical protein